ncbi:type II secretion system protein [Thiomicrorhabdus sp. Milos-T2]|uniref:type II secretion system protein n=1 Tax=Thiomicrorhabdus sp. Milos-T2 TaxID=90814 RepID=UPI00056FAED2|nr:type II secretion system protein [Thiomicrorhabdus sp. Milos-T2]
MPGKCRKNKKYITSQSNNKVKGFSLLELTIVLGIVGVLGAGSVLVYSEQATHAKWQESQQKLKVAKKAILKFAEVNKYMPCPDTNGTGADFRTTAKGKIPAIPATPATPAVPKTTTAPTIPAIPSTGAQPAIPNIDVSTCTANSGTVPYDAIGLSKSDVQDSWGNLFVYAVDQGVTVADEMLRCPAATACFFNGDSKPVLPAGKIFPGSVLPAFDLTTEPLKGALGANNLRICADSACSTVESEGLVAVLLALNENGQVTSGLDASEAENQDGDKDFVNDSYSEAPYYDDLILGISANEIKTRHEDEAVEVASGGSSSGPTIKTGQNIINAGDGTAIGAVGDNNSRSTNVTTDVYTQNFDFGSSHAGKKVVLELDTLSRGTWDQPNNASDTTYADNAGIYANGDKLETIKYDSADATSIDGTNLFYDPADSGSYKNMVYWEDSWDYVVDLDSNGEVSVDFTVSTTGTDEVVDFSNIQLTLYDTPPEIPSFPSVSPIAGVTESEGLE